MMSTYKQIWTCRTADVIGTTCECHPSGTKLASLPLLYIWPLSIPWVSCGTVQPPELSSRRHTVLQWQGWQKHSCLPTKICANSPATYCSRASPCLAVIFGPCPVYQPWGRHLTLTICSLYTNSICNSNVTSYMLQFVFPVGPGLVATANPAWTSRAKVSGHNKNCAP